jgi:putative DNA-invertase from lambdoid prophage Rac
MVTDDSKIEQFNARRSGGGLLVIGIYIRVSTSKQETRSQRKAIADWCRKCAYPDAELIEYVDDGISGKTTDRPAFKRLLRDVDSNKIDKIITFELSRLSRNFLDLLEVMRTLTLRRVKVEVPGEGAIQFDSTMEQFVVAAKSLTGAQERERISERTKAGLAAAKALGVKLGAPKGAKRRKGKFKCYETEDPETVARIIKMRSLGFSTHDIAMAVGYSQSKVFRVLKRAT